MTASPEARGKIGYVLAVFPAATQTFVAREIEALKGRGFDIVVFALKRPDVVLSQYLSAADTLYSCEYARPDSLLRHLLANLGAVLGHPVRYLSALAAFAREGTRLEPSTFARLLYHFAWGVGLASRARHLKVEHLHCHFASGCSAALAANLFSGITFSFTAHASGDIYVKPILLDLKVRQARFVVPVCDYNRRYLDSITHFANSGKLHRVYNGVDVEESAQLLPHPQDGQVIGQRSPMDYRLLSVGTLVGFKGHATLIEVCHRLQTEGFALQCTIVGSGPDQAVLQRRIHEAGLSDVVQLAGLLSIGEVYRAMRATDIFILLSEIGVNGYRDAFPTVILEAMAVGLPVVSTWVSGIPEMVADQVTGILVPERNPSAATAAIRRLLQDPALRASMGSAGKQRVAQLFRLEDSTDQLARLLSETLSAPAYAAPPPSARPTWSEKPG